MKSKNDTNSHQIAIALELLKLLAQKPLRRSELIEALSPFLHDVGDPEQKICRLVKKLKACGFDIRSAPNRPYELAESAFPVILSSQQREALEIAANFLDDMGFSAQASQILRIGNISQTTKSPSLKADFNPPVDYSESKLDDLVHLLQERCRQQRRFVIWYRNSQGMQKSWDLDKSELRWHNGTLYLFAFVPDSPSQYIEKQPNVEQNYLFRVDRILSVGAASITPWFMSHFPTLEILYRLSGALGTYKIRRPHEREYYREENGHFVDILTREDYLFWFRQRILQYGACALVLNPRWLAELIGNELKQAYLSYFKNT